MHGRKTGKSHSGNEAEPKVRSDDSVRPIQDEEGPSSVRSQDAGCANWVAVRTSIIFGYYAIQPTYRRERLQTFF